jgi:hypothetical protein
VWRYLSNFRKNKETLTNGRGRRRRRSEDAIFLSSGTRRRAPEERASELAGILIGMPALTYFLVKNFLLRSTGR